jgi:hypothetical protein
MSRQRGYNQRKRMPGFAGASGYGQIQRYFMIANTQ